MEMLRLSSFLTIFARTASASSPSSKNFKQDKNLRYVFKELPILSPGSRLAAQAALVVWKYQKERYLIFMQN